MKTPVNRIIFCILLLLPVLSTLVYPQDTSLRRPINSSNSRKPKHKAGNRRAINPAGISPLLPAYSIAVRAGDLVFVSGMTGIKPGTQDIVEGGIAVQTQQALDNIRTSLQPAGATMSDVAECTVFLLDMADFSAMNEVYVKFFPSDPPARATVAVSALPRPAARVEIKCSAVVQH